MSPNPHPLLALALPVRLAILAVVLAWTPLAAQGAETPAPVETPAQRDARVAWWRDARFGMFIHWGPVSLTGQEISWSRANSNPACPNKGPIPVAEYDNLYKQFNPTQFDAKQWVAIAQAAGMKYMVLTAKHCDGFLLWDSKVSDYNIMHTPFKRDVCAELAKAAHDAGMRIGWYFSPPDWRDPDFRTARNAEFVKRMQAELTELLSNYGKIDVLWFDTDGWSPADYDQPATYALIRRLQPGIIIDERLGGNAPPGVAGADYYTPEQRIGGFDRDRLWESCMTISGRGQWSWGGPEDGVKPFAQCLNMLVGCAGGDGNVLLNVGPMPTGQIAPEQVKPLKEMGAWLAKYGASIYGTRGGPFKPGEYGVSTCKGSTIYLHVQKWPAVPLLLPAIPAKILRTHALTAGDTVSVKQTDDGIEVSRQAGDPHASDSVIALELDRPAGAIAPLFVPSPAARSLTGGKKATASSVYHNDATHGADKAFDYDDSTRWGAESGVKSAWLEVDLGQPCTIGRAVIHQAYSELKLVRKFAIETKQGDAWKACYQGENMGAILDVTFPPVTAQYVRLNVTEASGDPAHGGPTISEFQLFKP
ncbi:MAG: alpha-L-fucosidase [Lentisphaeria bacterium]|jgi:alpha-L-fucosidase